METILVRLMLLAALAQFGISLASFRDCGSRACIARVERASRDVLKVDWKPISVWPEEVRRFR